MPIATTCPNCKAIFRLAETLAGKKVRCQKCSQVFTVPAISASPPPAAVTPPLSLSLDDAPVLPSVVQPPPPAALIEPSTDAEVIEATMLAPPPEPVIEAQLAEPVPRTTRDKPSDAASASSPKPPRRRAADLPKHSSTGAGALAALALVVICAGLIACFAGIWVVLKP